MSTAASSSAVDNQILSQRSDYDEDLVELEMATHASREEDSLLLERYGKSCSKMSKAVSPSAVDSQILPQRSDYDEDLVELDMALDASREEAIQFEAVPANEPADSPMPSVGLYAAASQMLPRAVDESAEAVLVMTDSYAPHLDPRTSDEIAADIISRYRVELPRSPLHEIAVDISNRHGQTLRPLVLYLAGGTTSVFTVSDRQIHAGLSHYWRRTYTMPTETSFDSGDETDPEMPALVEDPQQRPVISVPRTPDEHPSVAGFGLVGLEELD